MVYMHAYREQEYLPLNWPLLVNKPPSTPPNFFTIYMQIKKNHQKPKKKKKPKLQSNISSNLAASQSKSFLRAAWRASLSLALIILGIVINFLLGSFAITFALFLDCKYIKGCEVLDMIDGVSSYSREVPFFCGAAVHYLTIKSLIPLRVTGSSPAPVLFFYNF